MQKRRSSLPVLLDRHRAALAACRSCGLGDPTAVPLISDARSPRVMLVGQAPGRTETVVPRPFAGRAGRTLFGWLAGVGIGEEPFRSEVYMAAVTRCFPGPSPSGRGDRVPSPRERALCRPWLDEELRIIRPALLILVGRLAIDVFLPDAPPLDQVVGRAHDVRHVGGRSMAVPLPHPSGASSWIHGPGHRELVDDALALIRAEFDRLGVIPGDAGQTRVA
ncbi:MAG TPA: uracil-DNA glycosylase [Gemmatimonadales bacterium]